MFGSYADSVCSRLRFYKQYKSIQPYLQAEKPADGREHLQSKEDRLKLDGMYEVRRRFWSRGEVPLPLLESGAEV